MKQLFNILFLIGFMVLFVLNLSNCRSSQQEDLAKYLEIDTKRYPLDYGFPFGYFRSTLTPDMTITEVHKQIHGYTKVFQCLENREVYYYYSNDDQRALRFEVWYDEGMFSDIIGEDTNSRTIRIDGCISGQLSDISTFD